MVAKNIGRLSSATARSNILLVAIYCATLMWCWEIYSPIGSIPFSTSASPIGGYSHFPFLNQKIQIEVHRSTQFWKILRFLIIKGVITHDYDPKRSTDLTINK